MIKQELAREDLDYAIKDFEYARKHTPNFGQALVNSLLKISDFVEMIPVSSMDLETYFNLNLKFMKLCENLSKHRLEKEAMLAERISTDFTHRYVVSHPFK